MQKLSVQVAVVAGLSCALTALTLLCPAPTRSQGYPGYPGSGAPTPTPGSGYPGTNPTPTPTSSGGYPGYPGNKPTPTPSGSYPGYPGSTPTPTPSSGYPGYPGGSPMPTPVPTPVPTAIPTPTATPVSGPLLDVMISGVDGYSYQGAGIYNLTGYGQTQSATVTAGTAATYYVKVQNEGSTAGAFTLTAPSGSGGWTVAYVSFGTAAQDITAALTGTGWATPQLGPGASAIIQVNVTPGVTLPAGNSLALPIAASAPPPLWAGATSQQDVVQVITTVAVGSGPSPTPTAGATPTPAPTAAPHVDALIHKGTNVILNGNNPPAYLGAGLYNTTGAQQTATQTTVPANAAVYSIKAQNNTSIPTTLQVTGGASGNGWTVTYFDALQGGNDITAQVTGTGWATPTLDPGSATELRVEVTPDTTISTDAVKTIAVTATLPADASVLDVVQATTTRTREITSLRYSLDNGTTWIAMPQPGDANYPLVANYDDVIGFKIVRAHPEQPWPLLPDPGLTWDHRGYPYIGDAIWVRFNQPSPDNDHLEVVTATWGDTLTARIKVLPAVPDP